MMRGDHVQTILLGRSVAGAFAARPVSPGCRAVRRGLARMSEALNWEDLRLFLATARSGSARGAAAALGVGHSTVARRLDAFETRLGTRLFDRTGSGYAITEAGGRLREHAERMEAIAIEAERAIDGRDLKLEGPVRLTLPLSSAHEILMPALARFAERYPAVDLIVRTSDDALDLSRREADVALRFVRLGGTPPAHLIGRHLGTSLSTAYARPDYIASHRLSGPEANGCWLGWEDEGRQPDWARQSGLPDLPVRHGFAEALLQVTAARAGLGVALIPCILGDRDPALMRVPGLEPVPKFDIWILSHPDLRDTARLRALREHLAAAIVAEEAGFLGHGAATA